MYYAFEEIENFRRQLLNDNELNRITARETQSIAYGALLFRIVNFFKCRNIIEIGGSTGVMGLYLSMASRTRCNCWLLDERQGLARLVRRFAAAHHLTKFQYIEGDYRENITHLCAKLSEVDLFFINRLPGTMAIEEILWLCQPLTSKRSILLLDGIGRNKKMRNTWKKLRQDPQSRIMIDLYAMGMVFFDDRFPKRYYTAYFNEKQKQNLHTNRRQGLHFISRRKKSTQNASSH
jgi:predicted O-methyltransferase YrrM